MSTTTPDAEHEAPASPDTPVLRAAKAPVGVGSAPLVAQLLALLLIALGVVGVQEALVRSGAIHGSSWTGAAVSSVDGTRWTDPLVLAVGIVAVVLGLLMLPVGLLRRPRRSVALQAETGVYLRTKDLAKIATAAVEGADAVTDVHVDARSRSLKVRATTVAAKDRNVEIARDLEGRLATSLDSVEHTPRTKVYIRNEDPS
ncbi:MAG: hypothetical protein JWR42_1448 [Marmoricola sp.]|nr:hypothetical protein [Marmoricola sp.]